MKIFLSVGTHSQQFNRLLEEMDSLLGSEKLKAEAFAQAGNSSYEAKNFAWKKFLSEKEYNERMDWADIVVSHGGAGTIINALLRGKKLLIVPRLKNFGEHTNDHQLDLANAFAEEGKAIAVLDIKDLAKKIGETKKFRPRIASNKQALVSEIKNFLERME